MVHSDDDHIDDGTGAMAPGRPGPADLGAGTRGVAGGWRAGRAADVWRRAARTVAERVTTGEELRPRPPLFDVLLVVTFLAVAALVYAGDPVSPHALPVATVWGGWVLIGAQVVPLAWRRVVPVVAMALTGIATGVSAMIGYEPGVAGAAVLIALYSVAAYGSREDGRTSLVITLAFIGASLGTAWFRGAPIGPIDVAITLFLFVGVWALGDRTRVRREVVAQLRARAEEAERSRELMTGLAVADERTRIARELHDVVAHTVSLMVVQAGAGRRVAEHDPAQAALALGSIESTGREALAELRRMVGVLRDPSDRDRDLAPQPTLADVPALVARLAATGIPVHLVQEGRVRPLPSGVELSAYRIVQEALTNVLKHAVPVTRVEVELLHRPEALVVRVRDDGRGVTTTAGHGGSGLVGMRERVAMFGGRLSVGPLMGAGFGVRAELPLEPPAHGSAGIEPLGGEPVAPAPPGSAPPGAGRPQRAGGVRPEVRA